MVAHLNINTLFRMLIQLGNILRIKHSLFLQMEF